MKALLTAMMLAATALVLGATLVWTYHEPSPIPPSSNVLPGGPSFVSPSLASIQLAKPQAPQFLRPGASLTNSPLFDTLPKDRGSELSQPVPLHLDMLPPPPTPLQPGVYQTHPYATILIVPGRGIDDGILGVEPDTYSKMPRIKPHMDIIPKKSSP